MADEKGSIGIAKPSRDTRKKIPVTLQSNSIEKQDRPLRVLQRVVLIQGSEKVNSVQVSSAT